MATYVVTKVRKDPDGDDRHPHLDGVVTAPGVYYSRHEVAASIQAGHTWRTSAPGHSATIRALDECPHEGCTTSPHLTTDPKTGRLDELPEG